MYLISSKMDHTVPYWTMNKCWKFRGNNSTDHCVKSIQIWSFFWSVFSRIRTEYGEIRIISPYSVWMRENTDQKKLCISILFTQCTIIASTKKNVYKERFLQILTNEYWFQLKPDFTTDFKSLKQGNWFT